MCVVICRQLFGYEMVNSKTIKINDISLNTVKKSPRKDIIVYTVNNILYKKLVQLIN